jgi:uncharacterized protein
MPPLTYHTGQLAIQAEAKTTHIAERLAQWIGPVAEFSSEADLLLFAMVNGVNGEGTLNFSVLSGKAPLITISSESRIGLRHQADSNSVTGDLSLRFQPGLSPHVTAPTPCGGLAINYANARRARINGTLLPVMKGSEQCSELVTSETFTLCRKYIAPSLAASDTPHLGPVARQALELDDPWLQALVNQSESFFLATISLDGGPDVAHRGGPAGFLQLYSNSQRLSWQEFVGNGVFKSAGNIRATGRMTLLIPDLASGDGVEISGIATYSNLRAGRQQRTNPLEQHSEDFPVQGIIECEIQRAVRLRQLMSPRRPLATDGKITSCAPVDVQAPQ